MNERAEIIECKLEAFKSETPQSPQAEDRNADELAIYWQVVGRVHGEASMRVVERLNTTAVGLNDEPVQAMRVSDCGPTDSQVGTWSKHWHGLCWQIM